VEKNNFYHFWSPLEKFWKNPLMPSPHGKNPSDPMPVRGVLETETDQELLKI